MKVLNFITGLLCKALVLWALVFSTALYLQPSRDFSLLLLAASLTFWGWGKELDLLTGPFSRAIFYLGDFIAWCFEIPISIFLGILWLVSTPRVLTPINRWIEHAQEKVRWGGPRIIEDARYKLKGG